MDLVCLDDTVFCLLNCSACTVQYIGTVLEGHFWTELIIML